MRTALAILLGGTLAVAQSADYVVLAGVPEGDPWDAAAQSLARRHHAPILRLDPGALGRLTGPLRAADPANVALVLRPDQIDFAFARRFLQLATAIDDDPFVDFAFGYITGRTPDDALALADAGANLAPRSPARVATIAGGVERSFANRAPHLLRRASLDATRLWVAGEQAFPDTGRDGEFLARHLPGIAGCDAVTFIGHGMPDGVLGGPGPRDLAGLRLAGAVVLNVACYTGVTGTWFEDDWQHGVVRRRTVAPEDSFCLALLRTGVLGYTAYLCPRPAGPELDTDLAALLAAGASLGEARRRDLDKTVLGYLGFGAERMVLADVSDGQELPPHRDPVRDIMLEGATGGVLFGDPAAVPFAAQPDEHPVAIDVRAGEDGLRVDVEVPGHAVFTQCSDPTAQFDGTMAMKVHARLPLGDRHVTDVVVDSLRVGRTRLPSRVLWAVEHDRGARWLQLKVAFPRRDAVTGRLSLTARVRTTADPAAGRLRGGEVQAPPPPPADVRKREVTDAMRARAEANGVPATALQAAVDATAQAIGDAGAPADSSQRLAALGSEGFAAVCTLIEVGHAHAGTWLLLKATWRPGDERRLLALASRPPLPQFATWTVLEGLGVADTPEVRQYLGDRLAREADAGLYMATALGLAHLGAREHAAAIGARVLEFRSGWNGVEPHLIAALGALGGADAVAQLERIAGDARTGSRELALQQLERLDPAAAARARRDR